MENCSADANRGWDRIGERISGEFDWAETPPSVAVVRLISVATDCEPIAVDPLGRTIDPDALDRLLLSMTGGAEVEFTHASLDVTLHGDGTATVQPARR